MGKGWTCIMELSLRLRRVWDNRSHGDRYAMNTEGVIWECDLGTLVN